MPQQEVSFERNVTKRMPAPLRQPALLPELAEPRRFLAFDLEIAKQVGDIKDWKTVRPLGITCAAMAYENEGVIQTPYFCGPFTDYLDQLRPAARLTSAECQIIVTLLMGFVRNGLTLLTWNGLGFDLDILAEESGMVEECRELACHHVDMMFQIFCLKGFPLALETAALGMGLQGKTPGMHGALAPKMWAAGQFDAVRDYVVQDATITLQLARAVESVGALTWTARSGSLQRLPLARWLTVAEAMHLREPDNAWMSDPWPRSKFTTWLSDQI